MKRIRATTLAEAFWTLDPFGLVHPDDPWHCDVEARFDPTRYGLIAPITRRLAPQKGRPDFVHLGVVGHKGTGKTTQVRKAMANLSAKGIEPIFIDALASVDQADLSFPDLILVISRGVVNALNEVGADVPGEERELVKLWFAEELLTETHRKEILGTLEAEAKASVGVSFLAKLTAKVTAVLRSDNEYRREIRRRAERDPIELVRRANFLLDAATTALSNKRSRPCTLAVVVDNLEKLADRRQIDAAILRRADDLRRLRCHLVLFFDPADQYAPSTVQAGQAFDVVTVPMLPIRERADQANHVADPALETIKELLDKRVDLEKIFASVPESLRTVVQFSGGRLRDVLHLARLACELADPDRVTPGHVVAAARRLKGERLTLATPGHWRRLAEIHRDKQVANDPSDAYLLLHSLVLNYDSDPWWDVHPLVRLDTRFDMAWKTLSPIAT